MMLTFLIDIDRVGTRIAIVSSVLVAVVLLHLNIEASLPDVGYLTFVGKFILLTYFICFMAFSSAIPSLLAL